jgi:hypothetical protein
MVVGSQVGARQRIPGDIIPQSRLACEQGSGCCRLMAMSRLGGLALLIVSCAEPPSGSLLDAEAAPAPDAASPARPDGAVPPDARATPDPSTADAGPDASDATAAACPEPTLDLAGLADYQRDIVARLAGAAEIEPGITLANRGTAANREVARRYLESSLRALGLQPLEHAYATGANVYAKLAGTTDTSEHVVLGAHFDTVVRSPGANDNATGVALVLGAGRALGRLGCRTRSVLLVFFDEEEAGLVGAKAFARKLMADGTAVHSVHTADQLGWDANGDRLMELERPDPGLRPLYEMAQRALGLTSPLVTTATGGSDHVAFRPAFRAVGITEGYASGDTTPQRHTPGDSAATVDLAYLGQATALVARAVAELLR